MEPSPRQDQMLRKLCSAAAILHPQPPAPNAAQATGKQLSERLAAATGTLQLICGGHLGVGTETAVIRTSETADVDEVEHLTLEIIEKVQAILAEDGRDPASQGAGSPIPLLSMNERVDIRRTIDFLIGRSLLLATRSVQKLLADPLMLENDQSAISHLEDLLRRLIALVNPPSVQEGMILDQPESSAMATRKSVAPITFITFTFRSIQHLPFILTSSLLLGWCQSFPPARFLSIRKGVIELLEALAPAECLSMLGAVLSVVTARKKPPGRVEILDGSGASTASPMWPSYVTQTAQVLMGKQLIRTGGVRGLMANVFGATMGKNEVIDAFKIDHIAKVVARLPVGMPAESYYESIVNQLCMIIRPPPKVAAFPDQYIHAACHIVCYLLVEKHDLVASSLLPRLHRAFLPLVPPEVAIDPTLDNVQLSSSEEVADALSLLLPLLTHAPPSVALLKMLVTPILPQLLALSVALGRDPTADPVTKADIEGVLRSWGRLVDEAEGTRLLVAAITSGRGWSDRTRDGRETYWQKTAESTGEEHTVGFAVCFGRPNVGSTFQIGKKTSTSPNIILSKGLRGETSGKSEDRMMQHDISMISEVELHPDPGIIVRLLQSMERPELAAGVLVAMLGVYRAASELDRPGSEAILYLQTVLKLAEVFGSSIFTKPDQILAFVEEALRTPAGSDPDMRDVHLAEERLRDKRVPDDNAGSDERLPDSDDEEEPVPDTREINKDDIDQMGMAETAIALFLAVLSGKEDINADNTPLLLPIERHLQRLARQSSSLKDSADQALLLLSVRRAMPLLKADQDDSTTPVTVLRYREALKLLSDPLLPVRGHGLIMLQDVVRADDFDRALVPGILDIFMRSIEDEDSFMYLNAVKGLSAMVDGLGREVLRTLVGAYSSGLSSSGTLSATELDRRLRFGEALMQSVRRCGSAIGAYVDVVVPPLIKVFPAAYLPTVLRTSSLSILAACADADWKALLPWTRDLVSACLDLIQIESVPLLRPSRQSQEPRESLDKDQARPASTSAEPLKTHDSKHPALRRAALVFLGILLDALSRHQWLMLEERGAQKVEPRISIVGADIQAKAHHQPVPSIIEYSTLARCRTIVGYVEATDEDDLVRVQAQEVLQILDSLVHAM